jgi:hypothetical protein
MKRFKLDQKAVGSTGGTPIVRMNDDSTAEDLWYVGSRNEEGCPTNQDRIGCEPRSKYFTEPDL